MAYRLSVLYGSYMQYILSTIKQGKPSPLQIKVEGNKHSFLLHRIQGQISTQSFADIGNVNSY